MNLSQWSQLDSWLKSSNKDFCIKGPAGTGKTQTILDIQKRYPDIVCVSFTNKAVRVLQKRGIKAYTIHGALFGVKPTGRQITKLKPQRDPMTGKILKQNGKTVYHQVLEDEYEFGFDQEALLRRGIVQPDGFNKIDDDQQPYKDFSNVVICVDEASMVSSEIWYNLYNEFDGKLLLVGDCNQLPPVEISLINELKKAENTKLTQKQRDDAQDRVVLWSPYFEWFSNKNPDIQLTKVYRQSAGSTILSVAQSVVATKAMPRGIKTSDVYISSKSDLEKDGLEFEELLCSYDQVLAWRNVTVDKWNLALRWKALGAVIQKTHQKNHWGLPVPGDKMMINARLVYMAGTKHGYNFIKGMELTITGIDTIDTQNGIGYYDIVVDGTPLPSVPIDLTPYGIQKAMGFEGLKTGYSYVITCHKAQGSQWDDVAIIDEYVNRDPEKWYYTAVTRAAKKLLVTTLK